MKYNVKNSLKKEKKKWEQHTILHVSTDFLSYYTVKKSLLDQCALQAMALYPLSASQVYIYNFVARERVDIFLLLLLFLLLAFFSLFSFFIFSISQSQFLLPPPLTVPLLPPLSHRSIPLLFPFGKDQASQG